MSSRLQLFRLPLKGTLRLPRFQTYPPTPLPRTTLLHGPLGLSRLAATSVSTFSTRAPLLNVKGPGRGSSKPRSDAEKASSEHEDPFSTPSVSLESLGIGKNMKIFLLGVLCVLGTIETWFWCKAIWIWWKGDERVETE